MNKCKIKRFRSTICSFIDNGGETIAVFLLTAGILFLQSVYLPVPLYAETEVSTQNAAAASEAEEKTDVKVLQNMQSEQADHPGILFGRPLGLIILDPGHGGKDPGAVHTCTYAGKMVTVEEKTINLAIAQNLRQRLVTAYPDIEVMITRDQDTYVSLWERAHSANTAETESGFGKLFISIHANAFSSGMVKGFEVWHYGDKLPETFIVSSVSEASINAYARELNLRLIEELHELDMLLAESLLTALDIGIGAGTYNRGIKQGDLYVLRNTFMPSVLVETGFITNQEEAVNLMNGSYQDRIAASLLKGIERYAEHSAAAEKSDSVSDFLSDSAD